MNKNENKEIEYKYFNVDTKALRDRLKSVNAKMVRPKIVMRMIRFTHPKNKPDSYIRIRDEGTRITMTSKTNLDDKFVTEYEIQISSFNQGINILESLGCKKIYDLEKFRETWTFMDAEIVIDSLPGTTEYVEIEGQDENQIIKIQHILGLDEPDTRKYDLYESEYGVKSSQIIKNIIKFDNAMETLYPNLQKNKQRFKLILGHQLQTLVHINRKKSNL